MDTANFRGGGNIVFDGYLLSDLTRHAMSPKEAPGVFLQALADGEARAAFMLAAPPTSPAPFVVVLDATDHSVTKLGEFDLALGSCSPQPIQALVSIVPYTGSPSGYVCRIASSVDLGSQPFAVMSCGVRASPFSVPPDRTINRSAVLPGQPDYPLVPIVATFFENIVIITFGTGPFGDGSFGYS